MLPKRVGNPNTNPLACGRSPTLMTGTDESCGGALIFSSTSAGSVSGTRKTLASATPEEAMPLAAASISVLTWPYLFLSGQGGREG